MFELLIAFGVFAGLAGLVLLTLLPPLTLAWLSLGLTLLGCLVGVPTGAYYHVVLRRELVALGSLEAGWYWHPNRYHERLTPEALSRVMPWFLVGALGFLLSVLGFCIGLVMLFAMR